MANLLLAAALGPMLLSWPMPTQYCTGAPLPASDVKGFEVWIREYDPTQNACWGEIDAYNVTHAGEPCPDGEIPQEYVDLQWDCWQDSSSPVYTTEYEVHEDFDTGPKTLSHTFMLEGGKHYMAMIRSLIDENDRPNYVVMSAWSAIRGKLITVGGTPPPNTDHPHIKIESIIFGGL